jgi:hypothetical protein
LVDAGDLASIATAAAVIVALVVGLAQVRATQRQRRDQAAVEICHDLVNDVFVASIQPIFELPAGASAAQVRALGPKVLAGIDQADFPLEAVGTLVAHRVIPLALVDDLMGGMVVEGWSRIAAHVEEKRGEKGWPSYGEWWQWLAERLEERHRASPRVPAHVALRDWRE